MRNWKRLAAITVVSGLTCALAVPVSARPFRVSHGRGPVVRGPVGWGYGGRSFGLVHRPGLLGQTDPLCVQNCRETNRLCLDGARIDAQACKQSTCSDESQAVQAACATDWRSTACQDARTAYRTCLRPCLDTYKTAIGTCQISKRACVPACASGATGQPDPQCVAGCRSSLRTCRMTAGTVAQGCYGDCRPLIDAAQQACWLTPRATECTTALQAARACLQPCDQAQQDALRSCVQDSQTCVATCVPVAPTPTPSPTS
jgi:hypothetical protein